MTGLCIAGEYVDPTDPLACLTCPLDTYQDDNDPVYLVDNCTKCPDGQGTREDGADTIELCEGWSGQHSLKFLFLEFFLEFCSFQGSHSTGKMVKVIPDRENTGKIEKKHRESTQNLKFERDLAKINKIEAE